MGAEWRLDSIMAIKDLFFGALSSTRKKLFDSFDRTDQSGLGASTDGSLWKSIRGSWSISGNSANSNSDTNYPIAVVDMPSTDSSVVIKNAQQGNAASIWVTDSGNWFAVGMSQGQVDCNCQYATQYVNGNFQEAWYYYAGNFAGYYSLSGYYGTYYCVVYNGSSCNNYANTCNAYSGGTCSGYNATSCGSYYYYYSNVNKKAVTNCSGYVGGNCKGYNATKCSSSTSRCSGSWNVSTCAVSYADSWYAEYPYYNAGTNYSSWNNSYSYTYLSCQTCYPQYIRVIQSVANVVSTVAEWTIDSVANAFKVKTAGNTVTVTPYSSADATSQIGSDLVYTATGAAVTTSYGIAIIPSTVNQSTAIASVEISNP